MSERKPEKNPIVEELRILGGNGSTPLPPIYSPLANVVVAVIGGVYAIVIFTFLSLRRLGRTSPEAHIMMTVLYFWTTILAVSVYLSSGGPFSEMFGSSEGAARFIHLISRALALVYLGLFFIRQGVRYQTMKFMGQEPPAAWWPAIFSIIAGTSAGMIVAWVAMVLRGP